jgi:rare lipoprotein A
MINRNGRSAARKRRLAVIAGAMIATAAIAVSATAGSPARADERAPRLTFEDAFAPFELRESELPSAVVHSPDDEAGIREIGSGMASYYGSAFAGRPTASGERFNPSALTAAHRTLPFGTRLKVTNPGNGRSVIVRINDRGPFHHGRVIDLSQEAARQIGLVRQGSGVVRLAALAS